MVPLSQSIFAAYDHFMKQLSRYIKSAAAVFSLVTTLAVPAGAATDEPLTNAKIMRNFNIIAFGNEYTQRRYKNVRKWAGPIRVGIQGKKIPSYFEAYVRQHIRDLWTITHHPIELYYSFAMQKTGELAKDFDPNKVNFILFYLPVEEIPKAVSKYFNHDEDQVRQMIKVSTCFAKLFTKKNEITAAIAIFPDHRPKEHMRACVVEEITQILGLANDSDRVNPSIFNDKSRHFELTEHDRWMLRMFYDPRITPGMSRQDAMRTGWQVLKEIRPGK